MLFVIIVYEVCYVIVFMFGGFFLKSVINWYDFKYYDGIWNG